MYFFEMYEVSKISMLTHLTTMQRYIKAVCDYAE